MKRISILLFVIVAALASCKKVPEVNTEYVDVERDLITVGTTTATIQCDYEYIATLKKAYLYYGEGADTINMSVAEMSVVQKTLYVELSGLKENTTYSYYYEFANGFNSMRSATRTFKTEGSGTTITMPTVVTAEVTEITSNSANGGGEVTNDGGAEVTERGICWSTTANPTISDSHVAAGTGTGAFAATMSGLRANTTYHVRAYATNEAGTAYGLDKEFTTPVFVPEGAISGLFTINENGDKVYFSKGNLQYQASTNTWRLAEHQWDYVGSGEYGNIYENNVKCDNALISETYDGWIDLFGWGTSGWNSGNSCYQPWSCSSISEHYGPIGHYDLSGVYANADWGVFNLIYNGGNTENQWRTLSWPEWEYVLKTRNTSSGMRYAKANVDYVNGVVILPDNWNGDIYNLNNPNNYNAEFNTNIISGSQWIILENAGAVFLPTAGGWYPTNNTLAGFGSYGYYWSISYSTAYLGYDAWSLCFFDTYLDYAIFPRCYRNSVRLVQDVNK